MRTKTKLCTFCRGTYLLHVAGERIVCPVHPELHNADGMPTFTPDQIATGEITIQRPARWPLGWRLAVIVSAVLSLWGLAVIAWVAPTAGFLLGCAVAMLLVAVHDGRIVRSTR